MLSERAFGRLFSPQPLCYTRTGTWEAGVLAGNIAYMLPQALAKVRNIPASAATDGKMVRGTAYLESLLISLFFLRFNNY